MKRVADNILTGFKKIQKRCHDRTDEASKLLLSEVERKGKIDEYIKVLEKFSKNPEICPVCDVPMSLEHITGDECILNDDIIDLIKTGLSGKYDTQTIKINENNITITESTYETEIVFSKDEKKKNSKTYKSIRKKY